MNDKTEERPQLQVIICRRGAKKPCSTANCDRAATKLCDYPLPGGGTCDRDICTRCATHMGDDVDYCPPHARLVKREQEAGRP